MSHVAVRDVDPVDASAVPDAGLDAPHLVTELPGPKARAHIAFDERYTSPSLPRAYPIVPVRGRGSVIEDIDGNRFLDFCAGIAVNVTGHAHPRVVAAIAQQAGELLHYSASDFYLPIYAHLAAELERIAPIHGPSRVFLGNSGTEVVEAAIKLARYSTGPPLPGQLPRWLPRAHVRERQPDGVQGEVPRPLRPAAAGRLPRAIRVGGPR